MEEESMDVEEAEIYPENLNDMNDGEDKKELSRIQIVKDLLENVELTISEIKELKGIIVSKQRVCEWESERIKLQMETQRCDGRKTRPPQLPIAALEKIFLSLSTKDVLSSRLVCQNWLQVATMELRKRTRKELPRRSDRMDKTKELLEVMKKSQLLPVTSLGLNMKNIEDKDLHLVIKFFQIFGPTVESLCVDFTGSTVDPSSFEWPLKMCLAGIQLDNLLKLTIISRESEVISSAVDIRTSLITAYFRSAKNLEKLIFDSENLSVLLKSLGNGTALLNCSILFLKTGKLGDEDLVNLGRVVKLKRLSLNIEHVEFKAETMKGFLQSQSETMEYLKLFGYSSTDGFIYEFPRMENLKILSIEYYNDNDDNEDIEEVQNKTLRFARINWNEFFPKLKEFKMRGEFEEHWTESLFPSGTISSLAHLELKILDFPGIRRSASMDLSVVSRIFPNIQTIKLSIHDLVEDPYLYLRHIWEDPFLPDVFPNMKKIVIRGVENIITEFHYGRNRDNYEHDITDSSEESQRKYYLKEFAWGLVLNRGMKHFCERLTTAVFEIFDQRRAAGEFQGG